MDGAGGSSSGRKRRPAKARLFLTAQRHGGPVSGLLVECVADLQPQGGETVKHSLGVLASDVDDWRLSPYSFGLERVPALA
jgi:hypothetical protein